MRRELRHRGPFKLHAFGDHLESCRSLAWLQGGASAPKVVHFELPSLDGASTIKLLFGKLLQVASIIF